MRNRAITCCVCGFRVQIILLTACNSNEPTKQPVKQISTGRGFACALGTGGNIECWGRRNNDFGQTDAPAGTYTAVSTGGVFACALTAGGNIECWGNNDFGQTDAPAGTYTAVSTGNTFACALGAGGNVECWGSNAFGQTDVPVEFTQ